MAEAISHWPLNMELWIQSKASPYGIYGGHISTGTGFSLNGSFLPSRYHSTNALY